MTKRVGIPPYVDKSLSQQESGGYDVITPIICIALGFLLGLLTAGSYYSRQAKKATKRRRPSCGKTQRITPLPQSDAAPVRIAAEDEPGTEILSPKPVQRQKPTALPSSSQQRDEHVQTEVNDLYQTFQIAGTLSLQFRYSFPLTSLFQPGIGYLRSQDNQLLPDKSLFVGMNTITGYAMNGTLWAFDMVLRGKEFTFSQIMEGQAGSGYVQPKAVLKPAIIAETSSPGYYRLVQAGKLEMQEMH